MIPLYAERPNAKYITAAFEWIIEQRGSLLRFALLPCYLAAVIVYLNIEEPHLYLPVIIAWCPLAMGALKKAEEAGTPVSNWRQLIAHLSLLDALPLIAVSLFVTWLIVDANNSTEAYIVAGLVYASKYYPTPFGFFLHSKSWISRHLLFPLQQSIASLPQLFTIAMLIGVLGIVIAISGGSNYFLSSEIIEMTLHKNAQEELWKWIAENPWVNRLFCSVIVIPIAFLEILFNSIIFFLHGYLIEREEHKNLLRELDSF